MDLSQALISKYSRADTDRVVAYVGNNPKRFAELFYCFQNGDKNTAQKAAWSVSYCAEKFPQLVIPYCRAMVDILALPDIHDGIKRNILRTFQYIAIPVDLEGEVLELCFAFLMNKQEAVAIRVFSMQVLDTLAEKYPEIRNELVVIIEDELPYAKPAFISRGRKILGRKR